MLARVPGGGRVVIGAALVWRVGVCESLGFTLTEYLLPHLNPAHRHTVSFLAGALAMAMAFSWFMVASFGPYRLAFEVQYPSFRTRKPHRLHGRSATP